MRTYQVGSPRGSGEAFVKKPAIREIPPHGLLPTGTEGGRMETHKDRRSQAVRRGSKQTGKAYFRTPQRQGRKKEGKKTRVMWARDALWKRQIRLGLYT